MIPLLNECRGHGRCLACSNPFFPIQTPGFSGLRLSIQSHPREGWVCVVKG